MHDLSELLPRVKLLSIAAASLLWLIACSPGTRQEPTAAAPSSPIVAPASSTARVTETPTAAATAPSPIVAAAPSVPAPGVSGNSYPGPYFKGNANAPLTLEEYADFQ